MTDSPLILGIAGSPRRGGTEILLKEALAAAEATGGIATEVIALRNEEVHYCQGCYRCSKGAYDVPGCRSHSDSMDRIYQRLISCRGLLLATPVYFGGVSAQMKTFMDRTEPLLRYVSGPWRNAMRNKIGAGIVVGQNRNGGEEAALQALHHFFFIHDMVVVGTGPDEKPGCYLGASGCSGLGTSVEDTSTKAVTKDSLGMRAAAIMGRRVAEAVKMVHAGQGVGAAVQGQDHGLSGRFGE